MDKSSKTAQQPFSGKRPPNHWIAGFLAWMLIAFMISQMLRPGVKEIPYSRFKKEVTGGKVASVHVKGHEVTGEFKKGVAAADAQEGRQKPKPFKTHIPSFGDDELLPLLEKQNVTIRIAPDTRSWFASVLIALLPWLLIIGFFVYSNKQIQQRMGGGGLFGGFGRSKAKLYDRSGSDVTFRDVAGLKHPKQELQEVVAFLKDPSKFIKLGGKLPRGILLAGPPGTGKTLMARAAAGEANVPFYSISGSEFIEMFVGVGASRVRDMFKRAKKEAPVIIFIDEIDSIGRVRGTGLGGGHDEREQTLNQILAEMDGFSPHESVIVLAATNRPDVLDPALVRPGRFDRRIILELPDRPSREKILRIHTRDMPAADDVDFDDLAGATVGLSGADLENLANEAAIIAARKDKTTVAAEDFDAAADKIRMGLRREDYISDREKEVIAVHESGHALTARLLPGADPLKKVTIIPHGQALGLTEQIPEEDRHNLNRSYLLNRIAILLGGRTAERLVFDDVSSGAGNDLKQSTQLARRMICQWGMSERLGPVTFPQGDTHPFLGKEIAEPKNYSEKTARIIDEEVQDMTRKMEGRARDILESRRDALDALSRELIRNETLDLDDIDRIIDAHPAEGKARVAQARPAEEGKERTA